jgi:hypothetical protein
MYDVLGKYINQSLHNLCYNVCVIVNRYKGNDERMVLAHLS